MLTILTCSISSRTLLAMAEDGLAFKFFARTDRHGRPYYALLFTGAVGIVLAYLNVSNTGATVFSWYEDIHPLLPSSLWY